MSGHWGQSSRREDLLSLVQILVIVLIVILILALLGYLR